MTTLHQNLPLQQRQIRLLDIPKASSPDDPLVGILRIVSLDSSQRFSALSYVWGPFANPTHVITVASKGSSSSHHLPITTSCWNVLRRLRCSVGPLSIWVDAICIDQQDENDKLGQLPLMGEIYSMADVVYVWLGEGTPRTVAAMGILKISGFQKLLEPVPDDNFAYDFENIPRGMDWWLAWRTCKLIWFGTAWGGFKKKGLASIPKTIVYYAKTIWGSNLFQSQDRHAIGIEMILRSEWKTRVWTLQEVLLSRNPVLCLGSEIVPVRNFAHGIVSETFSSNASHDYADPTEDYYPRVAWLQLFSLWTDLLQRGKQSQVGQASNSLKGHLEYLGQVRIRAIPITCLVHLVPSLILLLIVAVLLACTKPHIVGVVVEAILLCISVGYIGRITYICIRLMYRTLRVRRRLANLVTDLSVEDSIIDEVVTRKATQPQDQVVGAMAILQRLGFDFSRLNARDPYAELYHQFFMALQSWKMSGRLLFYAQGPLERDGPSWIPDLRYANESWSQVALSLDPQRLYNPGSTLAAPPREMLEPTLSLYNNAAIITAHGAFVGKVSHVSQEFYEVSVPPTDLQVGACLHNIRQMGDLWLLYRSSTSFHYVEESLGASTFMSVMYPILLERYRSMGSFAGLEAMENWVYIMEDYARIGDENMIFDKLRRNARLLRCNTLLFNNLAQKRRCLFMSSASDGSVKLGNGPQGIMYDDDIVRITRFLRDPTLVLRYMAPRNSFNVIGSAEMHDWQIRSGNVVSYARNRMGMEAVSEPFQEFTIE